jgi:hypothetical protein
MTNDSVVLVDPSGSNWGCFMFGTPFAEFGSPPPFSPCSVGVGGPGVSQGGFFFITDDGLPSAPGVYAAAPGFSGLFDINHGFEDIGSSDNYDTGTMSLTITDASAPEPASLSLMSIGLCFFCLIFKRQFGPALLSIVCFDAGARTCETPRPWRSRGSPARSR